MPPIRCPRQILLAIVWINVVIYEYVPSLTGNALLRFAIPALVNDVMRVRLPGCFGAVGQHHGIARLSVCRSRARHLWSERITSSQPANLQSNSHGRLLG